MIKESAVIGLLDVEILTPQGGFILGRSSLDVDDLGNGDEELLWTTYLASATRVTAKRGGKRTGAGNTMDVGTLNITLVNQGDPTDTPDMRPNAPIRIRSKLTGLPMFTGTVSDIDTTHNINKATNEINTFVQIVAVDGVQSHANTIRYGAVSPGGFERWESRIARLAASATAPVNPPALDAPIVRYSI